MDGLRWNCEHTRRSQAGFEAQGKEGGMRGRGLAAMAYAIAIVTAAVVSLLSSDWAVPIAFAGGLGAGLIAGVDLARRSESGRK